MLKERPRDRHANKSGEHWADSIGVPGLPEGSHFEIRYRITEEEDDANTFIEGLYFCGPHGSTDLFELMNIKNPRVVVGEVSAFKFNHATGEAHAPEVETLDDLLGCLHEMGHHTQSQEGPSSESLFQRVNTFAGIVDYLSQRGITLHFDQDQLAKANKIHTDLKANLKEGERISLDQFRTALNYSSVDERIAHLPTVCNTILEQDASRRVYEMFTKLEELQGVDFSKVQLNPSEVRKSMLSSRSTTMHPWVDTKAFLLGLDIALATHRADIPLFVIAKRYFGDACTFDHGVEEIKQLQALQPDQLFTKDKKGKTD